MTQYFEVVDRDGPARLGELRITPPVTTPATVDDVLEDYGSLWTDEHATPEEDDVGGVAVLPHRAMPSGTPEEILEAMQETHGDVDLDVATAAVTSVDAPEASGHDMHVLTGLREGDSRRVVEAALDCRRSLAPDSALYLPGVAAPANVATLAYLGFDCFDSDYAAVHGRGGSYMTTDGEVAVEKLDELPCCCTVCRDSSPDDLSPEEVAEHNVFALEAELSRVRSKIADGRLRDYVEGQCRSERWQVEVLRLLDEEETYLERRTPVARTTEMDCNVSESMDRIEVQRFAERVIERYTAPRSDACVLLPCSAGKPYSLSRSHSEFREAIAGRAHEVIVTSPLAVVPRGLENVYPAAHYDVPVTGRWTPTEQEFVEDVLTRYLELNRYEDVYVHLPEDYRPFVESACSSADVEPSFTCRDDEHPRDDEALERLRTSLDGLQTSGRQRERRWYARAVADHQFGEDSWDSLDDLRIQGQMPRIRVMQDDRQLAALTEYGSLALTLEGVEAFEPPDVEIEPFVPEGSVLAPGVVDADDSIRVADEVLFEGEECRGVGRAEMGGREMRDSSRGVAVSVRHLDDSV